MLLGQCKNDTFTYSAMFAYSGKVVASLIPIISGWQRTVVSLRKS